MALLSFVLGIWLWDHYFGKPEGYPPGTEEIALVKIDRDLRLADAMSADPPWLKWLAAVEEPFIARENAMEVLKNLAAENALNLQGLEAFAVIKATHENLPVREVLAEVMQGQALTDFDYASQLLSQHDGTWWQAKMVEAMEFNMRPAKHWRQAYGEDSQQLRARAITVRGAVWLLGALGLIFIPKMVVRLRDGMRNRPKGYGATWGVTLGLTVFLVATLAWIGFTMTLEIGISILPGLHPAAGILLDSAARMLPPLIALGLLFRRPSHAVRVMGLDQGVAVRTILGLFSLLMLVDQFLKFFLASDSAGEPGGGLSAGEAGLWGLAFAIVSACLLAPLAEELLYRGVLFRTFWKRLGVLPAAVISSGVFAVLHFYDGYGLASVAVFGLACAMLYAATGSLTSAICLHVLYNSSIKIPEWLIYHRPLG